MGIDPGLTTGVAWYESTRGKGGYEDKLAGHEQIGPSDEFIASERLAVLIMQEEPGLIAVEDFYLRGAGSVRSSDRAALSPVRVISALEVYLREILQYQGIVTYQGASAAKGIFTDARLKRMGFWVPGEQHSRDAYRHALLSFRRYKALEIKDAQGVVYVPAEEDAVDEGFGSAGEEEGEGE